MKLLGSLTKLWLILIFCGGFMVGTFSPAIAKVQFSYAGYSWNYAKNIGANVQIPYANPYVPPAGQSSEWVMSHDGTHYIQSGWIKRYGYSDPSYFIEYSCSTVCQSFYGAVPSNTTHVYKVELVPPNWCAYIDGVSYQCVDATTLGLADAIYADYSGETTDTKADLGGTPSNHFRMSNLQFKYLSDNIWYQVNTNYMMNLLTSHTPYSDSIGFTNPYTWIENWTNH